MLLTNKQKEFINNANHRYCIKIGARRCGKTYLDILYTIPSRIRERHGKKGLYVILGVTNSTIERNVLQPLRELYGKDLVGNINSQNIAKLFGEEVYCLGAEKISQVSKIQGTSIKYCYCDELARYNQEVFEMLKGSLDKAYSCLDATLNPENNNHWLKKGFIDTIEEKGLDVYLQHYTIFDNPFLPPEFIENICKEYEGTIYYNRLILGQWCDAEGIIFKSIANDKSKFIIDKASDTGFISIGIDFGGNMSNHTFVCSKIERDYSKIEVLKSRIVKAKDTDVYNISDELILFIRETLLEYGHIDTIFADCNEQSIINTLNRDLKNSGLAIPIKDIIENSIKTPLTERIKNISILLNTHRIKFIKNQTETIVQALQTAVYDDKTPDVWKDDFTSDIDSLDAFAYSFSYWFKQLMRSN